MRTISEIRLALRSLARTPSVTIVAIISMALGVGATAGVFAAIRFVLIQPLPYSHPESLVQIRTAGSGGRTPNQDWVAWLDMQNVSRENQSFTSVETYHYALFNLAGDSGSLPEALYGLSVSAGMFPMLGVSPMLGRTILREDAQPGHDSEMILSYGLWVRRFQRDPAVIGRKVQANGREYVIIGVMPQTFDFPLRLATPVSTPSRHMDFWAPLAVTAAQERRESVSYGAVARLRPGISLVRARQDLSTISERLAQIYPESNRGRTFEIAGLRDRTLGFAQTGLLLLFGAAFVFLLIGCANVANLLLARGLSRQREIAIRTALGTGRGRIARQLLVESGLLAGIGGLTGYGFAALAWQVLPALTPASIPRLGEAHADASVLAFALAVSMLSGIVAGVVPAWRISARDPGRALYQSGARGAAGSLNSRIRAFLLVSEVTIAVMLIVIGSSLTGRFVRLLGTDPGFSVDRVLASIIVPAGEDYQNHPEERTLLFRRILAGVRALPGVESAGVVDALPFSGENNGAPIAATQEALSRPDRQPIAEVDRISPGYLETMGVRLLQGRWFREEDIGPRSGTAIVNELVMNRFWPGGNAVGQSLCVNCGSGHPAAWRRIVGVVTNTRHAALDAPPALEVYIPSDSLASAQFVVTRTVAPADIVARDIRGIVAAADPRQPVFLSATMSSLVGDSIADRRFILTLLGIIAGLSLLLSAAGIYGVVSWVTSRRTQEIGVRMALGATRRQVHAFVFRQCMVATAFGIVFGLVVALVGMRLLDESVDVVFVSGALGLIAVAAALACWMPARRAMGTDPLAALRQE